MLFKTSILLNIMSLPSKGNGMRGFGSSLNGLLLVIRKDRKISVYSLAEYIQTLRKIITTQKKLRKKEKEKLRKNVSFINFHEKIVTFIKKYTMLFIAILPEIRHHAMQYIHGIQITVTVSVH